MSRWKESLPATEEKILGVGTREGIVAVPAVMDDAAEEAHHDLRSLGRGSGGRAEFLMYLKKQKCANDVMHTRLCAEEDKYKGTINGRLHRHLRHQL